MGWVVFMVLFCFLREVLLNFIGFERWIVEREVKVLVGVFYVIFKGRGFLSDFI